MASIVLGNQSSFDGSTLGMTGAIIQNFLSHITPFKPVSMETLSRWIKKNLRDSGIDMNIFSPHSTRSASTSFAKQYVPLVNST